MDESSKILYVGLDVHKESIAVAYAPADRGADTASLTCDLRSAHLAARCGRTEFPHGERRSWRSRTRPLVIAPTPTVPAS